MLLGDLENQIESQEVRLFDMFALGPFMIWYALASKKKGGMDKWPRRALFVSGVMTIIYNYKNYKNIVPIVQEKYAKIEKTSETISAKLSGGNFLSKS